MLQQHEERRSELEAQVAQRRQAGRQADLTRKAVEEKIHRIEHAASCDRCFCAVIFPDMEAGSVEDLLGQTALRSEQMSESLIPFASTLWPMDQIDVSLSGLIGLVDKAPEQMMKWQEAGAFEATRMVLAHLKAHRPTTNITEIARTKPPGIEPGINFPKVRATAKLVADPVFF